jgi:hypothetical protein
MALGTVTKVDKYNVSNKRVRIYDVQLTSGANYTTGGETLNASTVDLRRITECIPIGLALPSGGATSRSVGVIYGTGNTSVKLLVHTTASAEAAGNSDQSTFTVRLRILGV